MDHIRCESRNAWPKQVPYLQDWTAPYIYDNQPWGTYLQRNGWSFEELLGISDIEPSSNPNHTTRIAAAITQAWCYFGLIHAITGLPVDTNRYVRMTADGHPVVTTVCLPDHLEHWRMSLARYPAESLSAYLRELDVLMKQIYAVVFRVMGKGEPLLTLQVSFSIQILWETLVGFKKRLFPTRHSLF
jgi:hypothetical protein